MTKLRHLITFKITTRMLLRGKQLPSLDELVFLAPDTRPAPSRERRPLLVFKLPSNSLTWPLTPSSLVSASAPSRKVSDELLEVCESSGLSLSSPFGVLKSKLTQKCRILHLN